MLWVKQRCDGWYGVEGICSPFHKGFLEASQYLARETYKGGGTLVSIGGHSNWLLK